jgi:dTDP-4-amino-4,6-dideoxygalactose transaminase
LDALGAPGTQLFYQARAGVFRALRRLLPRKGGVVLMPAYHHGVEVAAARAAGAALDFYRVRADMTVDLDDLHLRARARDVRGIYLIHYVGFPQAVTEVRALCRRQGLFLVEDCALALLSRDPSGRPLGSDGEAAIFCLYKSLPVPHGGLLRGLAFDPRRDPAIDSAPLASTLHHAGSLLLSHLELRSAALGPALRRFERAARRRLPGIGFRPAQTGTSVLGPRDLALGASALVPHLIARLDLDLIARRRRRNFQRLAEALDGVAPIVGAPLQPGVCPLFLPLRVRSRGHTKAEVRHALERLSVEAVDFWSGGDPACDPDMFPEVAALRREILELPCHQGLDDEAIDRVARAVKQVLGDER